MAWEKTKNVFSTDPADTAAEKAIQQSNMVGSFWGKSTPASSKEDGLYQRMTLDQIRKLVSRLGPSGWMSRSALSFSGAFPANSFRVAKNDAYLDGLPITEAGSNLNSDTESQITMPSPPGGGTRDDLAFLEVWLAEVPGSTTSLPSAVNKPSNTAVFKHGNVLYGGTNPVDDINEVNFEIRRRVQVQYRIRTVSGINFGVHPKGVTDSAVLAQGPLAAPSAIGYAAVPTDAGLYRAGNGSAAHQTALGTVDGYVYALPMFRVARTVGDTTIDTNEVTDLRDLWSGSPAAREGFGKGPDIASAANINPTGSYRLYDLTGSVNVEQIGSRDIDTRLTLRTISAVNFIHDPARLILPFGKVYRSVPNELVRFLSIVPGLWMLESRSGPTECVGVGQDFWGPTAPDGYLFANVTTDRNATTFEGLFTELLPALATFNARGTALGAFTANAGTDLLTLNTHGLAAGAVVHVANVGGALPGGLATLSKYYVINPTANTFQLALTRGGAAIDITSTGTGTHSIYPSFLVPDIRGKGVKYAGSGSAVETFLPAAVTTGTDEIAVVSNLDKWITGMPVLFTTSGTAPTGLVNSTVYNVIRISATAIKLASSLANAQNGIPIDITGQGTGVHTLTHSYLARAVGEQGGEEKHAISSVEALAHPHTIPYTFGGAIDGGGAGAGQIVAPSGNTSTSSHGGNTAMNITEPYMVCNYMVRV